MISKNLKRLNKAKAEVAKLEAALAADLSKELAALPAQYGFANAQDFAAAVVAAGGPRKRATPSQAPAGRPSKKLKRAKITDQIRAEVKKMAEEGKKGKEIAETLGISLPSVQNIKKALGMTTPRKGE